MNTDPQFIVTYKNHVQLVTPTRATASNYAAKASATFSTEAIVTRADTLEPIAYYRNGSLQP